jgi:hypothetical protein
MKKTLILLNYYNSNIENIPSLTPKLNSILIDIMLGDGHLYKSSITSNTRLEMSFGHKYKDFLKA